MTPDFALSFTSYVDANAALIDSTLAALTDGATATDGGLLDDDAHWELIDDMKGTLGESAANAVEDPDEQDEAISEAESWVASNLSSGTPREDVAMALWLEKRDSEATTLQWLKANLANVAA